MTDFQSSCIGASGKHSPIVVDHLSWPFSIKRAIIVAVIDVVMPPRCH